MQNMLTLIEEYDYSSILPSNFKQSIEVFLSFANIFVVDIRWCDTDHYHPTSFLLVRVYNCRFSSTWKPVIQVRDELNTVPFLSVVFKAYPRRITCWLKLPAPSSLNLSAQANIESSRMQPCRTTFR